MDCSGYDPGAFAKVPGLCGDLRCDWDRGRAFSVNRDVPAGFSYRRVRGVAVISCHKKRRPLPGLDFCSEGDKVTASHPKFAV
jgi:hypothetical protein